MTHSPSRDESNNGTTRLALNFDGRRELVWTSGESTMLEWQVGEIVSFRNSEWRVVDRADDGAGSLALTLACPG